MSRFYTEILWRSGFYRQLALKFYNVTRDVLFTEFLPFVIRETFQNLSSVAEIEGTVSRIAAFRIISRAY